MQIIMFKIFKLIVLDRDGVINDDSPLYIKSPDEWHAISGSLEAISKLQHCGYNIAIATNQSGIAKHYFTMQALDSIHKKMIAQITSVGGHLDINDIFICPHNPQDNCECRKPKSGLLLRAMRKFNVTPKETLIIGDSIRDILAAKACGAAAVLVKTGNGVKSQKAVKETEMDVPIYTDLAEVANFLATS